MAEGGLSRVLLLFCSGGILVLLATETLRWTPSFTDISRPCDRNPAPSAITSSRGRPNFSLLTDKVELTKFKDRDGLVFLPPLHAAWILGQEQHVLKVFDKVSCTTPDSIVLDIGANDGIFSLLAGTRGCQVIAVEVQNTCIEYARSAWRFNGVEDKIRLIRQPVSNIAGLAFSIPQGGQCSGGFAAAEAKNVPGEALRTITLDSIVRPDQKIVFLKIDIEGHEPQALQGARALFERKQVLSSVLESHRWPEMQEAKTAMETVSFLFDLGYELECLKEWGTAVSVRNKVWRTKTDWMSSYQELTAKADPNPRKLFNCIDLEVRLQKA